MRLIDIPIHLLLSACAVFALSSLSGNAEIGSIFVAMVFGPIMTALYAATRRIEPVVIPVLLCGFGTGALFMLMLVGVNSAEGTGLIVGRVPWVQDGKITQAGYWQFALASAKYGLAHAGVTTVTLIIRWMALRRHNRGARGTLR